MTESMETVSLTCTDPYAETIDWNAVWTARKLRHIAVPGYREGPGFFQQQANIERFFPRRDGRNARVERQLARLRTAPGTSVLDIGPGPGNLAIPLAERGCRVVAVEPAAPMRELLARNAAEAGVEVEVIPSAWEEIEPGALEGPFDLVIASYSLSMVDIRTALAKMHAACSGEVHLFWFLTPPPWGYVLKALWPAVHGAEYHFEPMADCLFNVLLQMGLFPAVEPEFAGDIRQYGALDEAVDEFAHRLNRRGGTHDDEIREGLLRLLRRADDGAWVLDRPNWHAHIWWNARGPPGGRPDLSTGHSFDRRT
ncbi:MAG: class I SAM-dependent methyltransferase [Methanospirillum sp.]